MNLGVFFGALDSLIIPRILYYFDPRDWPSWYALLFWLGVVYVACGYTRRNYLEKEVTWLNACHFFYSSKGINGILFAFGISTIIFFADFAEPLRHNWFYWLKESVFYCYYYPFCYFMYEGTITWQLTIPLLTAVAVIFLLRRIAAHSRRAKP